MADDEGLQGVRWLQNQEGLLQQNPILILESLQSCISRLVNEHFQFLDALAPLKTMFKIKSLMFSRFQDYRVLQGITECYSVLQSIAQCYRVLQSVTECYRVLQSISSASTWTNFWACFIYEAGYSHALQEKKVVSR